MQNGAADWDFFCGTFVSQRPVSFLRYTVVIAAAVAIMLFIVTYISVDEETKVNQRTSTVHPTGCAVFLLLQNDKGG